ncbi:hypothetical protein GCM10023311_14260 [Flaviramulus aquimarinus]|uniref:ABM domain-containing protein n=1 Tax=Flaviramulus aquimarinus TaxID=1170456 RepID=A0ABP9F337_9FLAO
MYIILYSFQVKPEKEQNFIKGWKDLTNLIYKHEGSLGSRLHKQSAYQYVAYAQWPDKSTFKASGEKLPKQEADKARSLMRSSCENIEILNELEVVEDLIRVKQND